VRAGGGCLALGDRSTGRRSATLVAAVSVQAHTVGTGIHWLDNRGARRRVWSWAVVSSARALSDLV
jgi:hypothetical protein